MPRLYVRLETTANGEFRGFRCALIGKIWLQLDEGR